MTVLKADEFVTKVAEAFTTEDSKMTKVAAKELIETFVGVIEDTIFEEQKGIRLGGIGTLKVRTLPERDFPVPGEDRTVTKPERYGVKFDVNKGFQRDLEAVPVK